MGKSGTRDLIQGTLDMLILRTLLRGALHGYAIAVAIEQRSGDELRVEEGALYPALHRLEVAGLLESEWKLSETNRRAKFYRLTPEGEKRLQDEASNWERLAAAVARVMEAI
jgi:PadR family transcriptional regulator, regulatory protein PadR